MPTFKPKQHNLLPWYKPYNALEMIDNNIIGHKIMFGYAY